MDSSGTTKSSISSESLGRKVTKAFKAFVRIARDVYEGIKRWLGDKLGAVFDGIKEKVDAVIGFFGDMKDKVVGNSIVPDMVDGVGEEFDRMGQLMAKKTGEATAAVAAKLENMTEQAKGWMGRFKGAMAGSLKDMLKGITGGKGVSGLLQGIGKGITQGIGNLISGGLAALTNLAMKGIVSLGKKIWGGIKRLFGGKSKAQKAREAAAAATAVQAAAEAAAAAEALAWAMAAIRVELLGLPTLAVTEEFDALRKVWEKMRPDERVRAMDNYVAALEAAAAAGVVLSAGELRLLDAFVARNSAMDEATARQEYEMAALSDRQDAEMEALATRRAAALDAIMASQNEQLSMLKEIQRKELDELKAAQEAELSVIKAVRAAALGVVESAIQRELEDERIAAQLKIDIRKAGGDQEAIDAAHARAATATERLLERDELSDMMAEAEERVRARYQDELDTINDHWDKVEAVTTERFQDELTSLETANAVELAEIEAAHTAQREALLLALQLERVDLQAAHAIELTDLQFAHAAKLAEIEELLVGGKAGGIRR